MLILASAALAEVRHSEALSRSSEAVSTSNQRSLSKVVLLFQKAASTISPGSVKGTNTALPRSVAFGLMGQSRPPYTAFSIRNFIRGSCKRG